jgi:hypothetical protein
MLINKVKIQQHLGIFSRKKKRYYLNKDILQVNTGYENPQGINSKLTLNHAEYRAISVSR